MDDQHLRRLTIFVDEPEPGQFYWVMIESTDDAAVWLDVESALEPVSTWEEAFDKGVTCLKSQVNDKMRGPQALGEDENASPVGITTSS